MTTMNKKFTYEEIVETIESLKFSGSSKSKDLVKLTNAFCKLQNIRSLSSEEVEKLFDVSLKKAGENDWKFLLEVFSRLFYKYDLKYGPKKNRPVNTIFSSLQKAVENKFGDGLDKDALNKIVIENDPLQIKNFAQELEKSTDLKDEEFLALLYMLFMLYCNRLLSQNNSLLNIVKCLLELYGIPDPKDKYCVKAIVSVLKGPNPRVDLYPFIGLYDGTSLKLSQLEEGIDDQRKIVEIQKAEALSLRSEIGSLQTRMSALSADVHEKEKQIASLESDLAARKDQNEFNENLYQKQFETLKTEYVKKIKRDLRLELQGIEDLADALPDGLKGKIQRRLENIQKILLKEEN